MRETKVEVRLRDGIAKLGGRAYKFVSPGRRKVPDRLILLPGADLTFAEMKRPGAEPDRGQLREHDFLRSLGFEVAVLDTYAKVDAFLESKR